MKGFDSSKGALRSGADLIKAQASAVADSADQFNRDQELRERAFVANVHNYLADQGLVAVPVEPTGNMVKAALHAIPPEWGVCTGRQMMDIYEAMATAAGEG